MSEAEVRELLKNNGGWTYTPRTRKGHTYIYAQRKVEQRQQERYVGPLATISTLAAQTLVAKLS